MALFQRINPGLNIGAERSVKQIIARDLIESAQFKPRP